MKPSEHVKTILAWIGLIAIIPSTILAFQTAGVVRTLLIISLVVFVILVWRWRAFLNVVRNTETVHTVNILNDEGDVRYERSTTLLPFLWAVRKSEIWMSMDQTDAHIESVSANCEIEWEQQDQHLWKGTAKLERHRWYAPTSS